MVSPFCALMKRFSSQLFGFFCSEITKLSGEGNAPEGRPCGETWIGWKSLIPTFQHLKGGCKEGGASLSTGSPLEKMRENVHKLLQGRVQLVTRG